MRRLGFGGRGLGGRVIASLHPEGSDVALSQISMMTPVAPPDCAAGLALVDAARRVVTAHDAQAAALAGEAVNAAIEAAKHLTFAVARLRELIDEPEA